MSSSDTSSNLSHHAANRELSNDEHLSDIESSSSDDEKGSDAQKTSVVHGKAENDEDSEASDVGDHDAAEDSDALSERQREADDSEGMDESRSAEKGHVQGDEDDSDAPSERQPQGGGSDSDAPSERMPENNDDSSDAPSERRPLDESDDASEKPGNDFDAQIGRRKVHYRSSQDDEDEKGKALNDIALSGSDSDEDSKGDKKELTEDDIVGPRLYPDPDASAAEGDHLEPTIVEVETARICPNFTEEGLYFVKFPNFLSIEPRPFDREHYEDEFDEDDVQDEEGRARLKLRVENTIRWRYTLDDDGTNLLKQANSKIVRWSDGTMSLYLGGEIFDVMVQPVQQDNHVFLRQGAGLQGHAVFKEKLVFRPHSTDSITHRKMTLSMADRSNKSQKVKVLTAVGEDPESRKAEIVRKEEERLRAQSRREAQQRRKSMRPSVRAGLNTNFLEDRDDESDEESINAIKHRFKHGYDDRPLIGHSDSEESDSKRDAKRENEESDSDQERRKQKKKKLIIDDEDDE